NNSESKTNRINLALLSNFNNQKKKMINPHEINKKPKLVINPVIVENVSSRIINSSNFPSNMVDIIGSTTFSNKIITKGAVIFGDSFKLVKNDFGFHKKLIKVKSNPLFFILYCTRPLSKMIFVSLYHM